MISKRKETVIELGNGDVTHKVTLESDECVKEGEAATLIKIGMLKQICLNPHLVFCKTFDFETLTMKYWQGRWIIESKYTELLKQNQS